MFYIIGRKKGYHLFPKNHHSNEDGQGGLVVKVFDSYDPKVVGLASLTCSFAILSIDFSPLNEMQNRGSLYQVSKGLHTSGL